MCFLLKRRASSTDANGYGVKFNVKCHLQTTSKHDIFQNVTGYESIDWIIKISYLAIG